jgi:hypothetical protein
MFNTLLLLFSYKTGQRIVTPGDPHKETHKGKRIELIRFPYESLVIVQRVADRETCDRETCDSETRDRESCDRETSDCETCDRRRET